MIKRGMAIDNAPIDESTIDTFLEPAESFFIFPLAGIGGRDAEAAPRSLIPLGDVFLLKRSFVLFNAIDGTDVPGWFRPAAAWASRRNRAMAVSSLLILSGRNLRATMRFSFISWAL